MTPDKTALMERDREIFELVHNGTPQREVARMYGMSAANVCRIYKKLWKEHCDMASFEKVRATSGLNHLVQIGREKYRGDCHLPNGKVKTKEFKYDREEATEQWLAWIEEVELDWEERHRVPDEDTLALNNPVRNAILTDPPIIEETPETTWEGPAVTTKGTEAIVVAVERTDELYLLHRADWQGVPMLFRSLDRALSTAASLGKVAGVEFDVMEVAFWDGED